MELQPFIELAKWIGLPTLIMLIYGPPVVTMAYFLVWHWRFTGLIVENNAKAITILESIQRDGVKSRPT